MAKSETVSRTRTGKTTQRNGQQRPQTVRIVARTYALGFESLPALLSFGALCGLLLLGPRYLSGFWPSTYDYWPQAAWLSLSAVVCLLLALSHTSTLRLDTTTRLLCAFASCCAFSIAIAAYRHDALLEGARLAGIVAWFCIVRALWQGPNEAAAARRLWILAAIVLGALIVAMPAVYDWTQTHNPRQFGTFYNPNLLAAFEAMALPFAFALALELASRARRVDANRALWNVGVGIAVLGALLIAAGLFVTSSKGGFLACLLGLFVFAISVWRARGKIISGVLKARRMVVLPLAIVLLLGVGGLAQKTVLPRLQAVRGVDDNSTMFRVYTWRSTLQMIKARPLLGHGAGSFPTVYPQFAQTGYTRSAHQSWLQIAAESGTPALLFLLGACGCAAWKHWRALKGASWTLAAASLGALTAFAAQGMTDAGWSITSIALLLMLSLDDFGTADAEAPPISPRKSALNWSWLLSALGLAFCGAWTQRAAQGEDLRAESQSLAKQGQFAVAAQRAEEATQADPLSARMWLNRAHLFGDLRFAGALQSLQRVVEVQPGRGLNWLQFAESQNDSSAIRRAFNRAVALDPNDTSIRRTRAEWLLFQNGNDARGWADIEYIARLADAPYGLYPATPQIIDLNFAWAFYRLAQHALEHHDKPAAQRFIARGLAEVARAKIPANLEAQHNYELATESSIDAQRDAQLETLDSELTRLKAQAQ